MIEQFRRSSMVDFAAGVAFDRMTDEGEPQGVPLRPCAR
jgi:hypothetical protein